MERLIRRILTDSRFKRAGDFGVPVCMQSRFFRRLLRVSDGRSFWAHESYWLIRRIALRGSNEYDVRIASRGAMGNDFGTVSDRESRKKMKLLRATAQTRDRTHLVNEVVSEKSVHILKPANVSAAQGCTAHRPSAETR